MTESSVPGKLSGRPWLVLGASGQVGHALLQELEARGYQAVGTHREHAQPGLLPWDGEAGSFDRLFDRLEPAAVLHAAGWTDVEACEADEARADHVNAAIPAWVAKRCAEAGLPYLFYSTEYVFDGLAGPYAETDPVNPLSAYGHSKLHGEERILTVCPDAVIARTTVVYGPDPNHKNFVAQLRRWLGNGEPMRVPHDQRSSPTYNVDLAAVSCDLVECGASGVWHVAGPEVMDRLAFARLAASTFDLPSHLLEGVGTADLRQKAARPLNAGLRIEKLRTELGDRMRSPSVALRDLRERTQAEIANPSARQ